VYPPLRLLETALSKHNPFVAVGKLCFRGFANQFNGDAELLDDLVLIFFLLSRLRFELIVVKE
jgi:hypothetical protein